MKVYAIITAAVAVPALLFRFTKAADRPLLWSAPFLIVALIWLRRTFVQPLDELNAVASRLRRGELEARPEGRLGEPWQETADALTELAERVDTVTTNLEAQVDARTAQLNHKASQLRALGQVGQQVAAVLEPQQLLHFVVRLVRGTFGYDLVAVVQQREGHFIVSACAARGMSDPPVGKLFRPTDPAVQRLVNSWQDGGTEPDPGSTHNIDPNANADRKENASAEAGAQVEAEVGPEAGVHAGADPQSTTIPIATEIDARAELVVPIRLGERTLGAMVVQRLHPDPFSDDDAFTVKTIAGQVAVALENARLFDTERRLRQLAITEERNRMAREIHDTLAQGFMGILMHLRALRGTKDAVAADKHRTEAESLAQQSLDEARRSVWNLRPARLQDSTLLVALEDELHRLHRQIGVEVELTVPDNGAIADDLSPDHAAALLRIAQEALHNIAKHAKAQRVGLTFRGTQEFVELLVEDDGVGFTSSPSAESDGVGFSPPPPGQTFGMLGMTERAQRLGGSVTFDSIPGSGTTVHVRLPLTRNAGGDIP